MEDYVSFSFVLMCSVKKKVDRRNQNDETSQVAGHHHHPYDAGVAGSNVMMKGSNYAGDHNQIFQLF